MVPQHKESMTVAEKLRTYLSPNPLTYYQLTTVGLREGLVRSFSDTSIDPNTDQCKNFQNEELTVMSFDCLINDLH